ncbi:hypothetical protein [Candidatus Igneacidithiobacillus taiwanensis]|uniref:hypothetical protein n=1 Tax=Candidatus Igneacidithiobacillus taiwanensis TaxID=1945924 RepID=UPI00289C804B|nr:hypothetical protein [Candidatus Igneacidithiobacillus taiwanensis]
MEPELTNDRARREWQWLCREVGETVARAALARLPGKRRPYPLNVARVLGIELPPEKDLPSLFVPADEADIDVAMAQVRSALHPHPTNQR